MKSMANLENIAQLAARLAVEVPRLSEKYSHMRTRSGRKEYTNAVGEFWNDYAVHRERGTAKWTVHTEYLTDFMLFEENYGPRIACESEWGASVGEVEWDFDKLCGVKADIKVLIHENRKGDLLKALARNCLAANSLITRGEGFLVVKFNGDKTDSRCWIPGRRGPFEADEIRFQSIAA